MMDPMANLDGGAASMNETTSSSTSSESYFDPVALGANLQRIDKIRSFMGIVSGCVAGIFGLTSFEGLFCFLILHLTVLLSIWAFKMNCDLKGYTRQSWPAYVTTNLQQCALSFMLFWTLFYGLVYLYD